MTYEQAKDQIAKKRGYQNEVSMRKYYWEHNFNFEPILVEAAELYADSVARDAWQRAIERFMVFNDFNPKTCDIPEYQPK